MASRKDVSSGSTCKTSLVEGGDGRRLRLAEVRDVSAWRAGHDVISVEAGSAGNVWMSCQAVIALR